ncbi:MAG TPA: hypothetical protein VIH52_02465 [Candidatus Nanoarchaeia archaeon]
MLGESIEIGVRLLIGERWLDLAPSIISKIKEKFGVTLEKLGAFVISERSSIIAYGVGGHPHLYEVRVNCPAVSDELIHVTVDSQATGSSGGHTVRSDEVADRIVQILEDKAKEDREALDVFLNAVPA